MTGARSAWQKVTIREVCNFKYGKALPESTRSGGDVPVFGSNGEVGRHNHALTVGPTIVIGRKGSFGEVNFSPTACWPIDTTYYVDATATKADLRWLAYRLVSIGLNKLNRAAAVPGLNREDAYRQELLLPPLPEQRLIADILDKADGLRAKRRSALAELDTFTQSVFLDMFGDPVTHARGWPKTRLANVTDMVTGYPFRSDEYVTNGDSVRLCRGANILPGRIDWSDLARWPRSKTAQVAEFNLKAGDVLIAMDRPWISDGFKIARVQAEDCPALLVQRVARLRGRNEMPSAYLFHLLRQPAFTRHCRPTETTIPHISPRDIRSFAFPFPPIDLQREFARRVGTVEKQVTAQHASLAQLDALFTSLQHRAFRRDL